MSFILIFKLLNLLLESKSIYSEPTVFVRGLRDAFIPVLVFYTNLKLNNKRVKYSAYSMEGEAVGWICVSSKQAGLVCKVCFSWFTL